MEDDKYHVKREFEETAALLKETAKKHMQAETSKGGVCVLFFPSATKFIHTKAL
jgi:hypothetical protein